MVSGVQEENSSSQNDSFTIQSILCVRHNKCLIEFLEGETITLDKAVTEEEGIFSGQVLSPAHIEDLRMRSVLKDAERISIKLVSNYLHSQSALRLKLIKRGFTQPIIDQVISKLTEASYLNDVEFARAWLLVRLEKHPEGKRLLFAGLKRRGIGNEIAREVIEDIFTSEIEEKCIRDVIIRRQARQGLDTEGLQKLLQTRGFSNGAIRRVLETMEC